MNKPTILYGIATATLLACSVCTVGAGTLKAAAAEAISETELAESKFESRGGHGGGGGHGWGNGGGGGGGHGWGSGGGGGGGLGLGGGLGGGWNPSLHGSESFTGPTAIALALPIAVLLIIALWVAAYNTLRSPKPQIGYNAGVVESAGWGGAQASSYVAGGYGYEPQGTEQQVVASNIASSAVIQAEASQGPASGQATGRAIDELTHRVVRSIERQEKQFI